MDYFYQISTYIALVNEDQQKKITVKLSYVEEDIKRTLQSFTAKDAIKSKVLVHATQKYADAYYRMSLYEVLNNIIKLIPPNRLSLELVNELRLFQERIKTNLHYSFNAQEPFTNPLPSYLFYSQARYSGVFSSKSCRAGISEQYVDSIAAKLKAGTLHPEHLRVQVYLAPYRGGLHLFAANNRTWVAFSRAEVIPSRLVPLVPTQDLLNRVGLLSIKSYPNEIINEDCECEITPSIRPGPKSYI